MRKTDCVVSGIYCCLCPTQTKVIKTRATMLPKKAIEEFKKIYKKSYGVDLSDEEATDKANRLVNLYKAVYSDEKWTLPKNFNEPKQDG